VPRAAGDGTIGQGGEFLVISEVIQCLLYTYSMPAGLVDHCRPRFIGLCITLATGKREQVAMALLCTTSHHKLLYCMDAFPKSTSSAVRLSSVIIVPSSPSLFTVAGCEALAARGSPARESCPGRLAAAHNTPPSYPTHSTTPSHTNEMSSQKCVRKRSQVTFPK
jgi:hypothetical protein